MNMPHMLAYTIQPTTSSGKPAVIIDVGHNRTWHVATNAPDDSYWFCFMNAKNPRVMVKEFVVSGSQNSTVPPGIDTYMNDPEYFFALATKTLSTLHVPQGAFFDFLVKYGAGRELQKLEQLNVVFGCGSYGNVSYTLTSGCGPRQPGKPAPASYERGSFSSESTMMMMSLMPGAHGAPPYSICDSYTWTSPPPTRA